MTDPRPLLFSAVDDRVVTVAVVAQEEGILAGAEPAARCVADLGLVLEHGMPEGKPVGPGDQVLRASGSPLQVAQLEERVVGLLGKPSGIATAARRFVDRTGGRPRIVSGAWKKLPFSQKDMIRSAVVVGGATPRIADWPFCYLDKNIVRMLGGVRAALAAVSAHPEIAGYRRVIQVLDADEACAAAIAGADIVFVDTGDRADLHASSAALRAAGLRDCVELAFGGGITVSDIDELRRADVDVLDVGREIVDAPLLDFSLRVLAVT